MYHKKSFFLPSIRKKSIVKIFLNCSSIIKSIFLLKISPVPSPLPPASSHTASPLLNPPEVSNISKELFSVGSGLGICRGIQPLIQQLLASITTESCMNDFEILVNALTLYLHWTAYRSGWRLGGCHSQVYLAVAQLENSAFVQ